MKTINLFDKEHTITAEFDCAICVWETIGNNLKTFADTKIKLGQKIFNVKILESGSIIFTLKPESKTYLVTMFPQMFGFPTEEQINEIKQLEDTISKSQDKINEIYSAIERTGYTDAP